MKNQPYRRRRKRNYRTDAFTRASDVTIYKADGSVVIEPAKSKKSLQRTLKTRESISPILREKIQLRDMGSCRYCCTTKGPFELDHVVPVALGGRSTYENLVTACRPCNQKKGARVWKPRPLEKHCAIVMAALAVRRKDNFKRRKSGISARTQGPGGGRASG